MSDPDFTINASYSRFPIGKYRYFEGDKAIEFIDYLLNEIEKEYFKMSNLSKNAKKSKKSNDTISIVYIGHADAIPFTGYLQYDPNDFGVINNEKFGTLLKSDNSNDKNKALAFLRAYGAKYSLENNLKNRIAKKAKSKILIEIHEERGGKYRYVEVILKFKHPQISQTK